MSEKEKQDSTGELTEARLLRDIALRSITSIRTFSETAKTNASLHTALDVRVRSLDKLVDQFNDAQSRVLKLLIGLGRSEEYNETDDIATITMEDHCYEIRTIAATLSSTITETSLYASPTVVNAGISLPKIELPKFNGDFINWLSFRDTFLSLVHENSSIGDIERFHYLLSCVNGPALTIIKSIPLSASNYHIAWNALLERFDNKRLLATSHVDRLFMFKPMTVESLTSLNYFINVFQDNVAALKGLGISDLAGFLLFFIGSRSLSASTRQLYEATVPPDTVPNLDSLLDFIHKRCKILENIQGSDRSEIRSSKFTKPTTSRLALTASSQPTHKLKQSTSHQSRSNKQCPMCDRGEHLAYRCSVFSTYSISQRRDYVRKNKLCFSCMSPTHVVNACKSKHSCAKCQQRHHTLLHVPTESDSTSTLPPHASTSLGGEAINSNTVFSGISSSGSMVLLGTAIIRIVDARGTYHRVRALLDSGSQISAMTTECVARIGLVRRRCANEIVGLSQSPVNHVRGSTSCTFTPHFTSNPRFNCHDLVILPKITSLLPSTSLLPNVRSHYSHLTLADPQFDSPSQIDMLLGGDVYPYLIRSESSIKHIAGCPSAMNTHLGWVIMGSVSSSGSSLSPLTSLVVTAGPSLDTLVHRFWSIEEPIAPVVPSTEDELCERWFLKTTTRSAEGRFCVALPFRDQVLAKDDGAQLGMSPNSNASPSRNLGGSRPLAMKRLLNLEHRLQKDNQLYEAYRSFMDEYLSLGHMKLATRPGKYFIPHHAVVKKDGATSKLRVVFDASAKSSSGVSLNDMLCVGPKLQNDISDLLLTCRLYKYMFTADIVKMYRQIEVREEDCVYQHILWRPSPDQEVQEFELLTVTYGLSSAPFLAIRVLHALDACSDPHFAFAKGVLSRHTYVDDIVVGRNTEAELILVQADTVELLRSAGCCLKKWCSNSSKILSKIPLEDRASCPSFEPKDEPSLKVLGLHWDPVTDNFGYHTHIENTPDTKRGVLSAIARLFDPIGALGPMLLWAKAFLQQLWQTKLDWDTQLPPQFRTSWRHFLSELPSLNRLNIMRHIDTREYQDVQLLGFSDASQLGYAATVYLRVVHMTGKISMSLITCKTKVAPLKGSGKDESLTIPRLELCGALLLAQLLHRLHLTIKSNVPISKIRAWTDSSVVLSWLTADQKMFKIFVTNRIAKIHTLLPNCDWAHVATTANPADLSSRGLLPGSLVACTLHWQGPEFIHLPEDSWPTSSPTSLDPRRLPEVKTTAICAVLVRDTPIFDGFLLRVSSWVRLQRALAYAIRFIDCAIFKRPASSGSLTPTELQRATWLAVRVTQRTHFPDLLKQLSTSAHVVTPPTIAHLAPFLDPSGLIRVGGRLQRSMLSEETKHPYLLPKVSHFTSLLINAFHRRFLHAGPKVVIAMLRQEFWILSGRDAVRNVLFKCVTCTRQKAQHPKPRMGILPEARVQSLRVFSSIGTDYGGPYVVKECKRRNTKTVKIYIVLFVCMAIKAIHVEIVSELTTEAFLSALDRFVARRGVPAHIYSDCGTNYVGAARQLKQLFKSKDVQTQVSAHLACEWHFNPPAAPHFGGLWEAGIKSVKSHLKQVIGAQVLTYEEFETLCVRVEGILNSRPLTPASSDPHDLTALTPGHFLIGQPILAVPEPDLEQVPMNRVSRWQLLRQLHQSFWKRWSREYLTTLQGRQKWTRIEGNLKVDDLVIIEAPNQPPSMWRMGRITAIHPGPDNIVRVISIATQDGEVKRPVVKVVKLPTEV